MSKKILITEENKEKIESLINAVQQKAKERTLGWSEVCDAEKRAKEVAGKLLKKHLKGMQFIYTMQEDLPQSYKYKYQATTILLEYTPKGWAFVQADRAYFFPSQKDQTGPRWNPKMKDEERVAREKEVKDHLYNKIFGY